MKRRNALAAALGIVMAGTVASALAAPPAGTRQGTARGAGKVTARAHATIAGEGISGTADFVEMAYDTGTEVEITVTAKGLKPGLHGVHLHAVGKCEPPAFTAAGDTSTRARRATPTRTRITPITSATFRTCG